MSPLPVTEIPKATQDIRSLFQYFCGLVRLNAVRRPKLAALEVSAVVLRSDT